MNKKKTVEIIVLAIALILVSFLSYKITLKIRTRAGVADTETTLSDPDVTVYTTLGSDATSAAGESAQPSVQSEAPTSSAPEASLPVPTEISMPTDDTWSLVLVNKWYKMTAEYEPQLSEISEGSSIYLDKRVAEKFAAMYDAAKAEGITLTPASGYVSLERQNRYFEKEVANLTAAGKTDAQAKAEAAFSVLPVGCSEHNIGLAMDIGWIGDTFADSAAYEWLRAHAAEYGFIERYTSAKESITGFNAEPWHWRYVGTSAAAEINSSGKCLEEYVGKVN